MVMFWVSLLAVSILLYVLLDGFDLGVGMLFGLANGEARRGAMLSAVAPIWDGNETWLVVTAVILWGAFPVVYASVAVGFLSACDRHVAGPDPARRGVRVPLQDRTGCAGSGIWALPAARLVATFIQGLMVGALVEGLPFANGEYSGGEFGWLTPFAVLCGIGLCLGYALLGACWLVRKCEGDVRDVARRQIPVLAVGVLVFLVVVFAYALAEHLPILHRWIDRPYLFVFPVIGRARGNGARAQHPEPRRLPAVLYGRADLRIGLRHPGAIVLALHDPVRLHHRRSRGAAVQPCVHVLGRRSFVFPLMLLYTVISYSVFRGKVRATAGYEHH